MITIGCGLLDEVAASSPSSGRADRETVLIKGYVSLRARATFKQRHCHSQWLRWKLVSGSEICVIKAEHSHDPTWSPLQLHSNVRWGFEMDKIENMAWELVNIDMLSC
jgi:hypothetical protein